MFISFVVFWYGGMTYLDKWNYQNLEYKQNSGMVFDFWACGPAANIKDKDGNMILRGAYPAKFLEHLKNALGSYPSRKQVAHICAGSVDKSEGMRVDISPVFKPDIQADAENFADEYLTKFFPAKISIADPPYNDLRAKGYYSQKKVLSKIKMLKQMAMITEEGGLVGLLDQMSPSTGPHIPNLKRVALIAVTSLPNQDIRAFTLWRKL